MTLAFFAPTLDGEGRQISIGREITQLTVPF